MSSVKYVENHNGKFIVVQGDQWIRHGIEHVNLIGHELRKFNQLLQLGKKLRPFQPDVIDGGSNMGSWSIPLARVHKDLTFHMFEVQRFLFWISCGNLALNQVLNARPNWRGLSDQVGTIQVPVPDYTVAGNFGAFEVEKPWANSDCALIYTDQQDTVLTTTIDALGVSPLLIKMDVEGMEARVIQGAQNTIGTYEPLVWCERQKSNPEVIVPQFTRRGYSLSFAIEGHWLFLPPWLNAHPDVASILSN
jgi:FkbM family methyltransferase